MLNFQFRYNLLVMLLFLVSAPLVGQYDVFRNTAGELTFTVQTITANGNFSPRHVLAIWVEDEADFVKTRKLRANQRKQYLYTWKASSNYNVVDAVTGSTLTSHQSHTISWDCTDVDGNIVPDGNYTVYVEFTEQHAQGPLLAIEFNKGTEEIHLTPEDETHFVDIALDYMPVINKIDNPLNENITVFPNPVNDKLKIELSNTNHFEVLVLNTSGNVLLNQEIHHESSYVEIDLSPLSSGMYFVEIRGTSGNSVYKILKF